MAAIEQKDTGLDTVQDLLINQQTLLEGKEEKSLEPALLAARWSKSEKLVNKPALSASAYYHEICNASTKLSPLTTLKLS